MRWGSGGSRRDELGEAGVISKVEGNISKDTKELLFDMSAFLVYMIYGYGYNSVEVNVITDYV